MAGGGPRWTQDEIIILVANWSTNSERVIKQKLPRHPYGGICHKADRLGLGPPSQGLISIHKAWQLAGLHRRDLLKALEWAGVEPRYVVRAHAPNRKLADKPHYRWQVVDEEEAMDAVRAWLNREKA